VAQGIENERPNVEERGISDALDALRRAFAEFLITPTRPLLRSCLMGFVGKLVKRGRTIASDRLSARAFIKVTTYP